MSKLRLLDLFCGAGGASMGYHLAGFDVTGVDIRPQPHYPFTFAQGNAMTWPLEGYDVIHASPPCQAYSSVTRDRSQHPDFYEEVRARLVRARVPWIIENVMGAPYRWGVRLCGSMFNLAADGEWLQRHRNFETSDLLFQPQCAHPSQRPIMVTGDSYVTEVRSYEHSRQGTYELACRLMGISWMTRAELAQAIPPAYTEWIGKEIRAGVGVEQVSGQCPGESSTKV